MNTELRHKMVTARKQHQCSLCIGRIRPGEEYERATIIWDNQIGDFLTCQPCLDDGIIGYADRMFGYDDGVEDEIAGEWAWEVITYPVGHSDEEIAAAKRYRARRNTAAQPVGNPDRFQPPRNPSKFGGAA